MARHKGPRRPPAQKKPALTHFLCLPLVTTESRPQLEASMKRFRDAVAVNETGVTPSMDQDADERRPTQRDLVSGVHPKAIRPVGALHCTLGVMSLDKARLEEALRTLKALDVETMLRDTRTELRNLSSKDSKPINGSGKPEVGPLSFERPISPSPVFRQAPALKIDLKGLVSMHPPHKTSILYTAPVDSSERLYPFCIALQKVFAEAGLIMPDDRPLRLHATIVNTIYAKSRKQRPARRQGREGTPETGQSGADGKNGSTAEAARQYGGEGEAADIGSKPALNDRSQGHGPKANAPLKMDATVLLAKFQNFVWAESMVLDRIAICEMGAKKIADAEGRVVHEEYTEVASIPLPGAAT